MIVRFQADADLNQNIVTGVLRSNPHIDFQTAASGGLIGLEDMKVLELAANSKRLLVSHDKRTMPLWFADFITTRTSSGVLIISQDLQIKDAIANLLLIWGASEAEEWVNRIAFIPF
jgi:hypothetical protein